MLRVSPTIKHLIIINALFWIATLLLRNSGIDLAELLALHFPLSEQFKPWQVLTHMFMHATFDPNGGIILMHILFNMFGLWMFGTPLEQLWGRNKFLFFYIFTGIGSAIVHTAVNYYYFNEGLQALLSAGISEGDIFSLLNSGQYNTRWYEIAPKGVMDNFLSAFLSSAVGASGALYGVLVAFAMLFPNAELFLIFVPIPIKAKYFVPLLIIGDLFFGFTSYSVGPIAHFAHVGGALFGFIMMWYWKRNQFNENRWDQ